MTRKAGVSPGSRSRPIPVVDSGSLGHPLSHGHRRPAADEIDITLTGVGNYPAARAAAIISGLLSAKVTACPVNRTIRDSSVVELVDLIRELRRELYETALAGVDEPLRLELGPVELEVTVGVERQGSADARLRFWVVEARRDGTADGLDDAAAQADEYALSMWRAILSLRWPRNRTASTLVRLTCW